MTDIDVQAIRERVERLRADAPHLDPFGNCVVKDRAELLALLDEAVEVFRPIWKQDPEVMFRGHLREYVRIAPIPISDLHTIHNFLRKIGVSYD